MSIRFGESFWEGKRLELHLKEWFRLVGWRNKTRPFKQKEQSEPSSSHTVMYGWSSVHMYVTCFIVSDLRQVLCLLSYRASNFIQQKAENIRGAQQHVLFYWAHAPSSCLGGTERLVAPQPPWFQCQHPAAAQTAEVEHTAKGRQCFKVAELISGMTGNGVQVGWCCIDVSTPLLKIQPWYLKVPQS